MCGIAGIIAPSLDADRLRVLTQRMTDSLRHRGPNDEGFHVEPGLGIGMRRLSIIDLAGGRQPIASEDGSVQVIQNGEIYNYLELRRELEARGHRFRTRSDTEVIAHLYEDAGRDCLTSLRGMFALAVWDGRRRRLLLGRDRLGKKPLYYAVDGDRLLFGSEIKAILAAAPELAEPDPDAQIEYLRQGFVADDRTMFRRIRKLPPGHSLVYQDGQAKVAPYWQPRLNMAHAEGGSAERWVEELDALLAESVRLRLMSEVPLGVFLSGGLDSSTIVAYAHRAGQRPLRTFTIGFDRPEWDESAAAERVARRFGTEHHVLRLAEADLARDLPETVLSLVRHFDEPFGDSSALPTYHVSRLAREHVTVILSGDGGDELFAGYSSYQSVKFAELYRRQPRWLARHLLPSLAGAAARYLPAPWRYQALRAGKVLADSALPFPTMYFSKLALCRPETLRQLLSNDVRVPGPAEEAARLPADVRTVWATDAPALGKALYADLRFRLVEDMLVKVDRMSMAHSLEVRSPFLDHRLVEFVGSMPLDLKLRGWEKKAILRDTVRPLLPPETLRKAKQGFAVPLREWFRTGLAEMVGDYLEVDRSLPAETFNGSFVRRLVAEHRRGVADHSAVIWLLLNYAVWHEHYVLANRQPSFVTA